MKLWLLRPIEGLEDNNPWEPWYDKSLGFVVREETEDQARQFAHANAGDENRGMFLGWQISNTKTPWLDAKYSTCEELTAEGDPGVIMQDFRAA